MYYPVIFLSFPVYFHVCYVAMEGCLVVLVQLVLCGVSGQRGGSDAWGESVCARASSAAVWCAAGKGAELDFSLGTVSTRSRRCRLCLVRVVLEPLESLSAC